MATVTGYAHGISTRSFIDAFGYPLYLETFGPERIVFVTDIPFRVTFVGSFDYRSEASFLQSPVTALEVATLSGAAVMRAAEFRVTLESLGRGEFGVILAGNDTITGGLGSNDSFGWGGNDVIVGGPENDVLDGGRGIDRLEGGAGRDIYYVDDPRDPIVDPDGGQVFSSARSYTLPEPLTSLVAAPGAKKVTLIGNDLDNDLSGGSGKDRLEGRGGNDTIEGGAGADTMLGGPGDDVHAVEHKKDLVVEQPGDGIDTVRASVAFTLPPHVENLHLEGRVAQGIGNEEDNRIEGAGLTTLLDGRGGDETILIRISGDNVAVTIRGGAGADRIRWEGRAPDTRPDTVADFTPAEGDLLDLDALLPAGAPRDPLAFVRLAPAPGGASLELDLDGAAGPMGWAALALLPGVAAGEAGLQTLLAAGAIELG